METSVFVIIGQKNLNNLIFKQLEKDLDIKIVDGKIKRKNKVIGEIDINNMLTLFSEAGNELLEKAKRSRLLIDL